MRAEKYRPLPTFDSFIQSYNRKAQAQFNWERSSKGDDDDEYVATIALKHWITAATTFYWSLAEVERFLTNSENHRLQCELRRLQVKWGAEIESLMGLSVYCWVNRDTLAKDCPGLSKLIESESYFAGWIIRTGELASACLDLGLNPFEVWDQFVQHRSLRQLITDFKLNEWGNEWKPPWINSRTEALICKSRYKKKRVRLAETHITRPQALKARVLFKKAVIELLKWEGSNYDRVLELEPV